MFYQEIKLALRHLWRKKIYSGIILLSLIIGFSCANLLISFLVAERNTDSFHTNKDRTFQVFSTDPFDHKGNIPFIMNYVGDYLKGNYPEVEKVCLVSSLDNPHIVTDKGEFENIQLLSTDSSFFSIFNFPLNEGSRKHAFNPGSIILTKEKAKVLFGETKVVGKTLTLKVADTSLVLTVSGLIGNGPENSHLVFEALIDHSALKNKWQGGSAYLLLNSGKHFKDLQNKINRDPSRPGVMGPASLDYFLEPMTESYFTPANTMPYMKTRSKFFMEIGYLVCGLILFMAGFNFANLFLLSLQERSKETGIKKTLGVTFERLLKSSFAEISIYILVAFLLSLLATSLLLPLFNNTLETSLAFSYLARIKVLAIIGLVVFALGAFVILISGIKQMHIHPVNLMKSNSVSKVTFSKLLFTLQFVISITMTICSLTVINQIKFIENEPLGFNRNIIQLRSPDKTLNAKLPILKQALLEISNIKQVAISSGNPISGNTIARYDLDNNEFYTPYLFSGDEDLIKTLDLNLVSGELFAAGKDGSLVNEELVRKFNLKNPIGETIPGTKNKIIGVVKDFTCGSFKEKIPPVIISYKANSNCLLIGYESELPSSLLSQIQKVWNTTFPGYLFEYKILQQDLLKKYKEDIFFYKLITAFSITTLIISCFGLFALSWAITQSRVKEIGIRKIFGARGKDILNLLTLSFLKRIAVAFVIAVPIAYFLMQNWLEHFVKRITIGPMVFAASAAMMLLIALITMSIQTIKAILLNPIDELREE